MPRGLHVLRDGPPDADVTVVFSHGYALDHRCWDPIAALLPAAVEHPVQVVRYDHRGHGRSTKATAATATVEQLGDDLAELLGEVARGSVVLVGHSMGGMALLALAERHPELLRGDLPRVAAMMLLSTGAGELAAEVRAATGLAVEASSGAGTGVSAVINRLMVDLEKVLGPKLVDVVTDRAHRAMSTATRWTLFGDDPREDDVLLTLRMVRDHWPRTMAMFRPGLDAYVRTAALRVPPEVPVVGLAGERDRLVPADRVEALVADRGTALVLPGAGHMLPLEAAAQILPRIVALVHEVQRRRGDRLGDEAGQPGD